MNSKLSPLISKTGKALKVLTSGGIPRRDGVSYFNFAIHSEIIYDDKTYKMLLKFAGDFYKLTQKRIAVCISTPFCPLVSQEMAKRKIPRDIFNKKVLGLSEIADIGYHGHFYKEDGRVISQISDANYDSAVVKSQIEKEMGWFKDEGITPRIYVGGWWFLNSDIILELERSGILVDASIRGGQVNTFGANYLKTDEIPEYGKPFVLPPSGSIIEIQSLFGPVMPAFMMKYHLARYLDTKITGELFYIFPLHDWDIPKYYHNIISNIKALDKSKGHIRWMDILDMRDAYLEKRNGSER